MYQVFTPADLLDATTAARPRIPTRKLVRTMVTLSAMVGGALLASRSGAELRQFCGQLSSFSMGCSGNPHTRDHVFRYATWGMLVATSPAAGMALRRWWAWVMPLVAVGAGYALTVAHVLPRA